MSPSENTSVNLIADFSTATMKAEDKFAFYCDHIADIYTGIDPKQHKDAHFDVDFKGFEFSDGMFSIMKTFGVQAHRNKTNRALKPDNSLYLNFCDFTDYQLRQNGEDRLIKRSVPVLIDNDNDFSFIAKPNSHYRLHSLRIFRNSLPNSLCPETIKSANDRINSSASGQLLSLQSRLICDAFRMEKFDLALSMVSPMIKLISGLLEEDPQIENDIDLSRATDLNNIKTVARQYAGQPEFNLKMLSNLLQVSPRTIQLRFNEENDTFSNWLLETRLKMAYQRIIDHQLESISTKAIMLQSGFTNPSHFYRNFKNTFGLTPGDLKKSSSKH